MGTEVEIVSAKAQSGAHDDLVENGGGGVDDKLRAASGSHDAVKVASMHFEDGNGGFGAQKMPGALDIPIAAADDVALSLEELCEERAGGAGSQDEDPHGWRK